MLSEVVIFRVFFKVEDFKLSIYIYIYCNIGE